MTRPNECKWIVKGWLERYPREWGLVLSKDAPLRECITSFYGEKLDEDEIEQYIKCWLYWYFHDVVDIPEHILDEIDWGKVAVAVKDLNLDEVFEFLKEHYPRLEPFLAEYERLTEEKQYRKALSLEEVDKMRWPTPEEAEKFCEMFPDVCERYPIVPEYLAQGQLTAEEAAEIAKKRPELFAEVDGLTLRELWERWLRAAYEKTKKEFEEAKELPEPQRTQKLAEIRKKIRTLDEFVTKFMQQQKEVEEIKREPSDVVSQPMPDELEAYLKLLDLNVVKWEAKKGLPEFRRKTAYFVTVIDEGTGEQVTIVWPYPYTTRGYRVINITNKRGKLVSVLVPEEEAKKKYVVPALITPPKKVQEVINKVEEETGEDKVEEATKEFAERVDWGYISDIVRKMQSIHKRLVKVAERRVILPIKTYLESLRDLANMALEHLKVNVEEIKYAVEKTAPEIRLTDADLRSLWELFCVLLGRHGLRCEKYQDIWAEWINPSWDFKYAEEMVYSLVSNIVAEERMKELEPQLEEPRPVRIPGVKLPEIKGFRWKYVNWGVSHIQFELEAAKHAVKERDVTDLVLHLTAILRDCEKLLKLLERAPRG